MSVKTLQIAVTEFLQQKFNEAYKEISGDTLDLYKFSTILDWNFDEFKHYDSEGKLVVNKYNFHERYIPVIVDGLIGDVEPVPNSFIVNANIPLLMIVNPDFVDETLLVVIEFLKNSIGKLYELDFKEKEGENYKIAFAVSLPDYSDFNIVQGEYNKEVSLDIACVISDKVYWGNDIEYELSYDNGNEDTFIPLYKIEPSTSKNKDLYINQIIGEEYTKGSTRTTTWQKSLTILCQKNKVCEYLIKYVDFGYSEFSLNKPNWVLKIKYNLFNEQIEKTKPVLIEEVSYTDDIGDFITISFTMVDKFL